MNSLSERLTTVIDALTIKIINNDLIIIDLNF